MYCFLEFKFCYLKNLKLFSIRVKSSIEPIIVLRTKADGFLLFLKRKIWKGNLYLTENRFSRTKCGVRWLITIICVIYVQKDF